MTATAAVNYFVDVQDVYGRRNEVLLSYYRDYVKRLIRSTQTLSYVLHERAMKQELARQTSSDCYVVGSSHEMRVNSSTYPVAAQQFGCKEIRNLAVSGGTYEDVLVMTSLIFEKPSVKAFLVGIGPWALRPNASSLWMNPPGMLPPARRALGLRDETENTLLVKMRELINGRYLWANLQHLNTPDPKAKIPTFRDREIALNGGYNPDGTYLYPVKPADRLVPGTPVPDGSWGIERPFVDPVVVAELEHVFTLLKKRGIQVALVLNPYHPQVFKCASAITCEALPIVEAAVRDLVQRVGLRVIGSYDPARYGFTELDFRDDSHLSKDELHRVDFTN
jgi:hypothetical protein